MSWFGSVNNLGGMNYGGMNLSGVTGQSSVNSAPSFMNLANSTVSNPSSSSGGLSGINYGQLGSIIGGAIAGPSQGQNQAVVNAADPFGQQRAGYQPMLAQLMTQGPQNTAATQYLKQQGANATNAAAAANGLTGSGNQLAALQQNAMGIAAQNQNQQYNQLAQLTGATINGTAQASQTMQGQNQAAAQGGSNIGGILGTVAQAAAQGGSNIGGILGTVAGSFFGNPAIGGAIGSSLGTVICTFMHQTGRMSREHYMIGARYSASKYDAQIMRGYHYWSIPTVKYLRKHPDGLFARSIYWLFNKRGEQIAEKKTVTGWLAMNSIHVFCWTLSRTVTRKDCDWSVLYRAQ